VAAHREAARRLAEDRDVARVAAERGDVALHPLEGGRLVGEAIVAVGAVVALVREPVGGEEPERAQPVVGADDHHALRRQVVTDVVRLLRRSGGEPATVDPEHDGKVVGVGGRPDVQRQAVVVGVRDRRDRRQRRVGVLGTGGAGHGGVENPAIGLPGVGRPPGVVPDRRGGVGNRQERPDAIDGAVAPAHLPEVGGDQEGIVRALGVVARTRSGRAFRAVVLRARPGVVVAVAAGRSDQPSAHRHQQPPVDHAGSPSTAKTVHTCAVG
jgi:hypothetical protein